MPIELQGSVSVAADWLDAILRRSSLTDAWPLTTMGMREGLAAAWVSLNRNHPAIDGADPDELVDDLASFESTDPVIWTGFELSEVAYFQAQLGDVDIDSWGWVVEPLIVALDVEGVLFVGDVPGPQRPALAFLMRWADGVWRVDAIGAPEELTPAAV
jgi:hypothetical protein